MQNLKHTIASRRTHRHGLSLVEVSFSTLLVGLVLLTALKSTGAVFQGRVSIADEADAVGLAQELISEIMAQDYEDPTEDPPVFGPDTGETTVPNSRQDFDDVDDYNGWSSSPPRNKGSATTRTEFTGYQRSVAIVYVDPDSPATTSGTDKDLKRITVTVTPPIGDPAILVAFRSRWGTLEQSPGSEMTVTTWVGSELQIGVGTPKVVQGTNITNHAED
jgi:MSHA pilin protein MshD